MRLLALITLGLASSLPAQVTTMTVDTTRRRECVVDRTAPGARVAGLFVHDALRNRQVVFGGVLGSCDRSVDQTNADPRTYVRVNEQWSVVATAGPRSRDEIAYGYDPRDGSIVFFGGRAQGESRDSRGLRERIPLRETWRFDGQRWLLVDTLGPPVRTGAQAAFDSARGRLVLFGGVEGNGGGRNAIYTTDTWEWDGSSWQRFDVPSPAGRTGHVMAYDPRSAMIIMHGGIRSVDGGIPLTDTWGWNGTRWRLLTMEGPRTIFGAATTALDSGIVVFGGHTMNGDVRETWHWSGKRWQAIATGGPEPRTFNHMTTDRRNRRIYMMGGMARETLTDLWVLDARNEWRKLN
jgi:N-acetylneuraminic acid mutarotase